MKTRTSCYVLSALSLFLITIDRGNGLKCFCNQFTITGCSKINSTLGECTDEAYCLATWERQNNVTPLVYMCEQNMALCKYRGPGAYASPTNQYPRVIACCTTDYCNTPDYLMYLVKTFVPDSTGTSISSTSSPTSPPMPAYVVPIILTLCITIIIILGIIIIFLIFNFYPKLFLFAHGTRHSPSSIPTAVDSGSYGEQSSDLMEDSGSGSGLPLLSQRSIAAQIVLHDIVGKGRFGEVWRGVYKGDDVAIKIFHTREETSWNHEVDIYQTCLIRHPNILRYIAADSKDMGIQMQLWLITEFCEHGSLYDFLMTHILDEHQVIQLIYSAICGLSHLHSEIVGREGKPAIVHRDLKSRNILVKCGLVCCIADLGLALRYDRDNDSIEELPNKRVGTRRYLAPEVITETIGTKNFESFKRADMYSFGLVMWEVVRRGECGGFAEEPQLPFFDVLPPDPTIDDMHKVVVDEKKRPSIPNRWSQSEVFNALSKIIQECWHDCSEARPTALRVKKSLTNLPLSLKGEKDKNEDKV